VSYLYFAQRLYHLPLGVFGIALATAIFPELTRRAVKQDRHGFDHMLGQGIRLAVFIAVGAAMGLILIRRELVVLLFQRGQFGSEHTPEVAWTLVFYSVGIPAYFLQQVLVRAFYSLQDSLTPVKTAASVIAVNVLLNLTLIWWLGTGGLALSTSLCSALQVAVLLVLLKRKHNSAAQGTIVAVLGKVAIAAAAMATTYALLWAWWPAPAWLKVTISVPVCTGVYLAAAAALGLEELKMLRRRPPKLQSSPADQSSPQALGPDSRD
jgi:putative peptidoglycan lipid II flippase